MHIEITPEQRDFLAEILRRDYQDLREEIYKTEDYRFKAELHRKESMAESLLKLLGESPIAKAG